MHVIEFSGGRAVEGPTTWAQEAVWRPIRRDRPNDGFMNSRFAIPLPPGTGIGEIAAAVSRVMTVHEGLRTTFPTTGAERLDVQRVHSSGVIDMPTVDLGESSVEEFTEVWGQQSFDLGAEWPVRFAVATSAGAPVALLGAGSHLITDKLGEGALISDLRAVLAGGDVWTGPARITAVGRAEEEATDRLKAISHRALTRWNDVLGAHETYMFGTALGGPDIWHRGTLLSPPATIAAEEIAARLRVSSATVFMAATGVLVAAVSGHASAALQSLLSNRFSEVETAFVGNIAQEWGLVLDIDSRSFAEIVRGTFETVLRSYRMGRYDHYDLRALRSELQERNGLTVEPWFDSFHNDSRSARARNAVRRGTGERVPTRTPDLPAFGIGHRLYVEVREIGDWVDIVVIVNPRFVAPGDPLVLAAAIERFLTGIAGGADGPAVALMAAAVDACGGAR